MKLQPENGEVVSNPDDAAIERMIRSIDGEENNFVILDSGRPDNWFIQTAGDQTALIVEYRQEGKQYTSGDTSVPVEKVISIFQRYARGDDSWKAELQWEVMDMGEVPADKGDAQADDGRGKGGCLGVVVLAVALAASAFVVLT